MKLGMYQMYQDLVHKHLVHVPTHKLWKCTAHISLTMNLGESDYFRQTVNSPREFWLISYDEKLHYWQSTRDSRKINVRSTDEEWEQICFLTQKKTREIGWTVKRNRSVGFIGSHLIPAFKCAKIQKLENKHMMCLLRSKYAGAY